MDKHIEVIGVLWIVFGVLSLLFGVFILLVLMGVSFVPEIEESAPLAPGIIRLVAYFVSSFLAIFGLPKVIAGIGLMRRREWARIMTLVLSFLELWNVPFGLALSIYSIVILFKPETIKLFNPNQVLPKPSA